jgi:hypothetical protein
VKRRDFDIVRFLQQRNITGQVAGSSGVAGGRRPVLGERAAPAASTGSEGRARPHLHRPEREAGRESRLRPAASGLSVVSPVRTLHPIDRPGLALFPAAFQGEPLPLQCCLTP